MKHSPLKRKTAMKRSWFNKQVPTGRTEKRGGDPTYLCFIRSLPCAICHKPGPSHPHHATLLGRGKSQKAHDHETMPMCFDHHRAFHDLTGYFDGWTRDGLKLFQELQIQRCRELWAEFVDPERWLRSNQVL